MGRTNYFMEGLQGAGKSTLVRLLSGKLKDYEVFHEERRRRHTGAYRQQVRRGVLLGYGDRVSDGPKRQEDDSAGTDSFPGFTGSRFGLAGIWPAPAGRGDAAVFYHAGGYPVSQYPVSGERYR